MFFVKLRHFAQLVGFAVIGLLILYGAFSMARNADRAIGANLLTLSNGPTMQTNVFSGHGTLYHLLSGDATRC